MNRSCGKDLKKFWISDRTLLRSCEGYHGFSSMRTATMARVSTRLRVSSDVICWGTGSEKVIFCDGSLFFISVFYQVHLVICFVRIVWMEIC